MVRDGAPLLLCYIVYPELRVRDIAKALVRGEACDLRFARVYSVETMTAYNNYVRAAYIRCSAVHMRKEV